MAINFLTFLGTGAYSEVDYLLPDKKTYRTRYAQEAILAYFKKKLDCKENSVIVFVTEQAKNRNWCCDNGLENIIKNVVPNMVIKPVQIESISDEASIWKLFDTVIENIPDNSEIILDITHAFRSLPMLGLVIVHFARIVKHISLRGIFYGSIDDSNKNTGWIVDLSQMDRLLQWSFAANSFYTTGSAREIDRLTNEQVGFIIQHSHDKNTVLLLERKLANKVKNILPILATCRSKAIIDGSEFTEISTITRQLHSYQNYSIKPLRSLYSLIEETTRLFKKNSFANLLCAVDLCIQYHLIQQGITLLQESIVTIMLHLLHVEDITKRENREAISRYFSFLERSDYYTHPKYEEEHKLIGEKIEQVPEIKVFHQIFNKLRDIRNDINHAGLTNQNINANTFEENLSKIFIESLTIFANNTIDNELHEVAIALLEKTRAV